MEDLWSEFNNTPADEPVLEPHQPDLLPHHADPQPPEPSPVEPIVESKAAVEDRATPVDRQPPHVEPQPLDQAAVEPRAAQPAATFAEAEEETKAIDSTSTVGVSVPMEVAESDAEAVEEESKTTAMATSTTADESGTKAIDSMAKKASELQTAVSVAVAEPAEESLTTVMGTSTTADKNNTQAIESKASEVATLQAAVSVALAEPQAHAVEAVEAEQAVAAAAPSPPFGADFSANTAQFFRLLHESGSVIEIRSFNCPIFPEAGKRRTASGYFDNLRSVLSGVNVLDLRKAPGVYCTLNPVQPGLLARARNRINNEAQATTTDEQIVRRRWIVLDIDPIRPAGVSATDAEMGEAVALAARIHQMLGSQGWPEPVWVLSGNGAYLLYRVELPNDKPATDLVQRVLHGLANRFDNQAAIVDRVPFNAARIIKIPGTTARKGDDFKGSAGNPARPHRVAKFRPPPGPLLPVPKELLEAVAAKPEEMVPQRAAAATNGRPARPLSKRRAASALNRCRNYVAKMPPAISGQDGSGRTLHVACECFRFGLSDADAMTVLAEFNRVCDPPWSEAELQHKLEDARRKVEEEGQIGSRLEAPGQPQHISAEIPGQVEKVGLPGVTLPGHHVPITEAAVKLAELLAKTGNFYVRGGLPVRAAIADAEVKLDVLRPAAVCSDFEGVARLSKYKDTKEGLELQPAICPEAIARQIIESQTFRSRLPGICVLSRCPVLIERDGVLVTITGYDPASGIWAMGKPPPDMSLDEAQSLLNTLLADFNFATPGDRSRAMAALITPALVFGGLLGGRAPIDAGEADQSQSGKGYRNKLTAAIYRNSPRAITQREGGVGSLQESFDTALVAGACFPSLDNLRGKIGIAAIESFMTELTYYARIPYSPPVEIDPTRTVVMLTTNKAELTPDMANRASIVRIRKHHDGFKFQRFPEGELLDHVQANQERYLAAVFAVIREWHRAGKPRLDNAPHDFRAWACTLGWIVEKLLHCAPLLTDHREIQVRTSSPAGNWLRDLALAVKAAGKLGKDLRAHELVEIILEHQVETPGVSAEVDLEDREQFMNAARLVGRRMSKAVTHDHVDVDGGTQVVRTTGHDDDGRERNLYRFLEREGQEQTPTPAVPECAPNAPAMKTPISPIPPIVAQGCNARAPAHDTESVLCIGDFGDSGDSKGGFDSVPACNHINPSAWRVEGDKSYCPGCGKFMGNVMERRA